MSYRKFKFISPGISINEIDNSQLPAEPTAMGPAIIGRLAQGPALKPVQVNSFAEFIDLFGKPSPGGKGGDVWRDGNFTAPTYAAYAAQAWLRNNSPVTVVRLLGQTNSNADAATAYAGWKTTNIAATTATSTNGGAFGLFICEGSGTALVHCSSTVADWSASAALSGTLAAIWYLNAGAIALSGQTLNTSATTFGKTMGTFMRATDTGPTFKVVIQNSSGTDVVNSDFNFDSTSPKFIRKVFNTNPTLTNSDITPTGSLNYWLGESFEGNVKTFRGIGAANASLGVSGTVPQNTWGVILRLSSPDSSTDGGDFRMSSTKSPVYQVAKTGWFISQDLTSNTASYNPEGMQKLFRLVAREQGEETQRKIKISIKDIRTSNDPTNDYGTFTVVVRKIQDIDSDPQILEQYNLCNLNPASDNYVAKKIGNKYERWSDDDRRYRYYGDYINVSDYVYVETQESVDRGDTNALYLPFGVYGPVRYVGMRVSGSTVTGQGVAAGTYNAIGTTPSSTNGIFITSGSINPITNNSGTFGSSSEGLVINAAFKFPQLLLRGSSSQGGTLSDPRDAYFGADTTYNTTKFDPSVRDVLRTKAEDLNPWDEVSSYTEASWVFSLDDVRNVNVTAQTYTSNYGVHAVYQSGSRATGISYTAHTGSSGATTAGPSTGSYENVIDQVAGGTTAGWNQFTTCMHGGSDGIDIAEKDPWNNTDLIGKTETSNAAYNSMNVAIDSLRDPEIVEYNLVTMPGVTNNTLNTKLIDMCENRGDALAIIDLQGGYKPSSENGNDRVERKGSITTVVNNLKNTLKANSSYGCAYYPWVQIRDTVNGATLWAPPSVVALGAMSYSEANSQLWFAPAGFTRGGLSVNRAAGLPVVGVEQRLTSRDRDTLYDVNVNPIASFPAEGIVVFGQKTLQLTQSALDRINVRRLVIFLKKQISRFAATILFDQNVQTTWNRFKSKVEPFLSDVKAGLGITDYRMILDETTTTPDLIDRNIMYAKIYVKPARAIEFIAIDFIITDSGASFED